MNTEDIDRQPANSPPDVPEVVAALIRTAGRRAAPPEAAYQRSLARATEAWRDKTARLRRRRVTALVAALAAGVMALYLVVPGTPRTAAPAGALAAATLDRTIGQLEVQTPALPGWQVVRTDGIRLLAGSRLRTGPASLVALRLQSGASLRLDQRTELVLVDTTRVELVSGRAYVDGGRQPSGGEPIEIVTSKATAREVGTQFEVALLGETYRLRVREGQVLLRFDGNQAQGAAGEQLLIRQDRALARSSIARTDPDWRWVESIATTPDVNDRPVAELLAWVGRETGRAIRYADLEVERRAATTILHGSIRHLAPLEALGVMLATTNLEYVELPDGTLLIQAKPTP